MQAMHDAKDIRDDGRYAVQARRVPATDLLSIYVNRVRKYYTDDVDQETVQEVIALKSGDLVESTGTLTIERIHE